MALYRSIGARRFQIFVIFVGKGLGMGLLGELLARRANTTYPELLGRITKPLKMAM